MSTLDDSTKVLIIGSGLSGVVLAQALRKLGVDFKIFERDDGTRWQGWTIGLDQCLEDLRSTLPDDVEDLNHACPNFSKGGPEQFTFVNPRTHEFLGSVGSLEVGTLITNRRSLRSILIGNLPIQYNKRFVNFEQTEDGVTAHFSDGSKASGSILVGADGANSPVRRQLFGASVAVPSKVVMLTASVVLEPSQYQPIFDLGKTGILLGEPGLKSYIILIEWIDDSHALFNWACAFLSQDAEKAHEWSQNATSEELYRKAAELSSHLPEYFVEAVKATPPGGMLTPPIRLMETVLPQDELPDERVTLVGDSAHSMVPFRGMGANTSITDACELARAISDGIKGKKDVGSVLREYEKIMIPRGRTKVLESRAEAESVDSFNISGGRI